MKRLKIGVTKEFTPILMVTTKLILVESKFCFFIPPLILNHKTGYFLYTMNLDFIDLLKIFKPRSI